MTVAEFYAKHAINRRAVLEGTQENPRRWLVRAQSGVAGGHVAYVYCWDKVIACRIVPADAELTQELHVSGVPEPPPMTGRPLGSKNYIKSPKRPVWPFEEAV